VAKPLVVGLSGGPPLVELTTGDLTLPGNASTALGAVPLQQLNALIPADYISGLKMAWVSSTSVSVSSGAAVLSSTGSPLTNTGTLTLSPSLAAATFYHVYLYNNAGTAAIEAVTTAPAAAYFGTARAKTGDTSRRYLGSFLTNSSSQIIKFRHGANNKIFYLLGVINQASLNNGAATTTTNVSLAAFIPVTSTLASVVLNNATTNASAYFGNSEMTSPALNVFNTLFAVGPNVANAFVDFVTDASQAVSYLMTATPTSGGASIVISGYTFER
jgi:hypothetical protein